jgi:O-antigen/teichoic acid export membrane protein
MSDARPGRQQGAVGGVRVSRSITSLMSGALRIVAMSGKFILLVGLAVYLEPSELGLFGLVVVTISYGLYVVGLDFYTFSSRELLALPRKAWGGLLRSEAALFGINYVVGILLLLMLFVGGLLPWRVAAWCCALLVIEHVAQELTRLFVVAGEQLFASMLLFVRQGSWCYLAAGLMAFWEETRSLTFVLAAWTAASSLTCLLGAMRLRRLPWGSGNRAVDWRWIRRGLRVALPLLGSTLALRALLTLDRYLQGYFTDLEALGAYVLFIGLAGAVLAFLDGAVHAFLYPSLITAAQSGQMANFRSLMTALLVRTTVICAAFATLVLLLAPYALRWIDRSEYLAHKALLPWLVAAMCIHALGLVPHFGLYAQSRDRHIMCSHMFGLLLFLPLSFAFSVTWPDLAVAMALFVSLLAVAVWKAAAYLSTARDLRRREDAPDNSESLRS